MAVHKNAALSKKFKLWFTEIYTLGDELKAYLISQDIKPGQVLSVEQALVIMGYINKVDGLRLKISKACDIARKKPELFSEGAVELSHAIGDAFKIVDEQLVNKYEKEAYEGLEKYIESRKAIQDPLGFDGEMKVDGVATTKQLIEQLKKPAHKTIDKRYLARARWDMAIAAVLEANNKKDTTWADNYETVKNYYERVDAQVKTQIRDNVQDEYHALIKLHEHFMKWLNIFEEVMHATEDDIRTLAGNLDDSANKKARMFQMLMRASASAALAPLFLSGFIDPALAIVNDIIMKVQLAKGELELNLSAQTIFNMTGFLPDPNKTTYKDAYKQLMSETIYDKINRYKKYLQHKIDSLSETAEFADMMADESTVWGNHHPDEIIRAHRVAIIEGGHYAYSEVKLSQPENENSLINAMVKPFNKMIDETFAPMKSQYGTKENLKSLHMLLDQVSFDDKKAGPESNNQQQETSLIKYLSSHLIIYFMVKFLVENSTYFGGKDHDQQLQHARRDLSETDDSYGLKADDATIEELVLALVKRIALTDNEALKSLLEIDTTQPVKDQVKTCLLTQSSYYSTARYRFNHCGSGCFFSSPYEPTNDHKKRRTMIQAIVSEYYNQDISEILQRYTVKFAQKLGITLGDPSHDNPNRDRIIDAKWISEKDIKEMVNEKVKPFINETEENKITRSVVGSGGLSYYRKARLMIDAQNLRAVETSTEQAESKKKKIRFD